MTALKFRVLGSFEVVCDGRLLDVGPTKQRATLAMLLVHANTVVSTDQLLNGLWSGEPPVNARHALQVYVSNLRKLLKAGRSPGGNGQVLITRRPGYLLYVPSEQLDAACFERLVANGRQALTDGRVGEASELLRGALGLWRGPALADLTDLPFTRAQIPRLEQLRLQALEARLDADLALGRHVDLVGELETLVAMHPLRERFWIQLMLALYRASRQGEALQTYQAARELLIEQLGIDPCMEMRQLQTAILRQDPTLASSAMAAGARYITTPNNLPAQPISFVGRERELIEVCQLLDTARLVTLTGVGTSKSRFAQEVAAARLAHHPDGIWLVELSSITEPDVVAPTVATILGVREYPQRPLTDLLGQHLRMTEVLLILDNCEHLVEAIVELAGRLLADCAGLRILATSRERLGITGEVLYPVSGPVMSQPGVRKASVVEYGDAPRLFVERAATVHSWPYPRRCPDCPRLGAQSGAGRCATAPCPAGASLSSCMQSSALRLMASCRTVTVEIDTGTVALAELAARHKGMPVAEWIARAARREFASISPAPHHVELTEAATLAENVERACGCRIGHPRW